MTEDKKKQVRAMLLKRRRRLDAEEVTRRSRAVIQRLLESGLLEGRDTVALYAAADNEVSTRPLFERLVAEGRRVVLPRVLGAGPELEFLVATEWDRLELGRFGIPEPAAGGQSVEPEEFDFVVVPGVGFDRRGERIGAGMGCYDRVLPRLRPQTPRVGLAFDFQLLAQVPSEAHDAPLTAVVGELCVVFPEGGAADRHIR